MKKKLTIVTILLAGLTLVINAQNALHFDGSNDFVQTTFVGVTGTNNRTFEAWVNVDAGAPSSNLCIMDYGANLIGSRNTFSVNGSLGLSFISGGTNANISSSTNVISKGQWTHVAFVLNNGTGYLYVNGSQVGTGSLSTVNTPTGNQKLKIGQRVSGGSIPFEGSIDEVRIWNVARTATQLSNNRNAEFCTLPQNLVAYYNFNQGSAGGTNTGISTLTEAVSGKNGTLTNFSLSGTSSNWVSGASITAGLSTTFSTITACDSMVSPSGNYTWTTTGNYTDTLQNSNNCDSLINVDLTVSNSIYTITNDSVCGPYTSPSGKHVYTTSGTYYDTLSLPSGCDWTVELNLVITIIDTNVTQLDHTLTSDEQNGDTYRWLDCANAHAPIGGASAQSFSPAQDGEYAVRVTRNNCVDTSDCMSVVGVGISSSARDTEIRLYPNPANQVITLDGLDASVNSEIEIQDLSGGVIRSYRHTGSNRKELVVKDIPTGVYLLRISSEGFVVTKKVVIK